MKKPGSQPAETALEVGKIGYGGVKIALRKIRPQLFRKIELAVSRLPQHKIGKPEIIPGPYDKIRVGAASGIKMRRNIVCRNVRPSLGAELTAGLDYFAARAVIQPEILNTVKLF